MAERFGPWILDDEGLTGPTNYFIHARDLGAKHDGTNASEWAHHVLEKTWVNPETFIPALKAGIEKHASGAGVDWDETMELVRRAAYRRMCDAEAERRLDPAGTRDGWTSDELLEARRLSARLFDVGWWPPRTLEIESRRNVEGGSD